MQNHAEAGAPSKADGWSPERYRKNAAFVAELAGPVLEWLAWQPGERILDLGCGDGVIGAFLAENGVKVVGCDRSPAQTGAASRIGSFPVAVADGAHLPFTAAFDAVFSNAALHWMKPPQAVADGIARALVPGGRMVAEMGGAGNVAAVRAALHAAITARGHKAAAIDPWYFPDVDEYRSVLAGAGLVVDRIELIRRPTPIPGSLGSWIQTLASPFLAALPAREHDAFIADASERAAPMLRGPDGKWVLDYVRLRVRARKAA